MDESEVLQDVLSRLETVAQHIIEMKSQMYNKSDHDRDSARIYDQMNANQAAINAAVRDAIQIMERQVALLRTDVATAMNNVVPRPELQARWESEDRRSDALTLRVANLELEARHLDKSLEEAKKPKVPMWLIVSGTAIITALVSALGNAAVGSLHFSWGAVQVVH